MQWLQSASFPQLWTTNGIPQQLQNSIIIRPDGTQMFFPQTQTIQAQAQSPQAQQNQQQPTQAQTQQAQLQQAAQQQVQTQPQVQQQPQTNTVQQTIVSLINLKSNFPFNHKIKSFITADSAEQHTGNAKQTAIGS